MQCLVEWAGDYVWKSGAGVWGSTTVHLGECSLCRCENPSVDLQKPREKQARWHMSIVPLRERHKGGFLWRLPVCPPLPSPILSRSHVITDLPSMSTSHYSWFLLSRWHTFPSLVKAKKLTPDREVIRGERWSRPSLAVVTGWRRTGGRTSLLGTGCSPMSGNDICSYVDEMSVGALPSGDQKQLVYRRLLHYGATIGSDLCLVQGIRQTE